MRGRLIAAAVLALAGGAAADAAVSGGIEVTSDARRRGISWSRGRVVPAVWADIARDALSLATTATATRGSRRHGGADAVIDVAPRYTRDLGAWRLAAGPTAHLFTGADGQDYVELDAAAGWSIGPLRLTGAASYAPRQRAIGGDNLYLTLRADAGIPGTPWTIAAGIGRSTGTTRAPIRANRLRPGGGYDDYRLAIEHVRDRFTMGGALTATSIGSRATALADGDHGTRLTAFVRFDL